MIEYPKVAVFGGSFNPPTLAHQAIIDGLLKTPEFDEVWVMPSGQRQDKELGDTAESRLLMLHKMRAEVFPDEPRLKISSFELALPQPTMTYRTVGALALAYPGYEFWHVFGADAYRGMSSWSHGAELQRSLNMVIVDRDNDRADVIRTNIQRLHIGIEKGVSSTKVREKIAAQEVISSFVCRGVEGVIMQQNLYAG